MTDFLFKLLALVAKPLVAMGLREDLALHVVAGFLLCAVGSALGGAWLGLGFTVAGALGREAYNKWGPEAQRTGWSWADVKATLVGGLAALSGAAPVLTAVLF